MTRAWCWLCPTGQVGNSRAAERLLTADFLFKQHHVLIIKSRDHFLSPLALQGTYCGSYQSPFCSLGEFYLPDCMFPSNQSWSLRISHLHLHHCILSGSRISSYLLCLNRKETSPNSILLMKERWNYFFPVTQINLFQKNKRSNEALNRWNSEYELSNVVN